MSFCSKCGKQIQSGAAFCSGCGTPVGNTANSGASRNTGNSNNTGGNAFSGFMDMPETRFDPADVESNKVMALFSYLGLLFLIPLLASPQSGYAKFHANQGIVLFITEMLGGIAVAIVVGILSFIPFIGAVIGGLLSGVFGLATMALMVIGIVNVANGKAKELPFIGKFKILN